MNRAGASLSALLAIVAACSLPSSGSASPGQAPDSPARVEVLELRHSDDALRSTYAAEKRMNLPRLVLLDGQGRPILIEVGMRAGIGNRLARALSKDQPLPSPITLALLLGEVVDPAGKPVRLADLPKADAYVVDYWAQWCGPCRELARDVERQLKRWDGRHVVWLKVESDPEKLPKRT